MAMKRRQPHHCPAVTSDVDPPTRAIADTRPTVRAVTTAWSASGWGWRFAAVATVSAALLATTHDRVPMASGVAIGLLVGAAVVDVHERRLPNMIVLGAAIAFVASVVAERAIRGVEAAAHVDVAHVLIGVAAFGGPLLVLHLASPAAMGFGDVKTAAVLGAATGAVDWQLAVSALAIAAGATAVVGLVRRAGTLPFGPGLVAAAALAVATPGVWIPAGVAP